MQCVHRWFLKSFSPRRTRRAQRKKRRKSVAGGSSKRKPKRQFLPHSKGSRQFWSAARIAALVFLSLRHLTTDAPARRCRPLCPINPAARLPDRYLDLLPLSFSALPAFSAVNFPISTSPQQRLPPLWFHHRPLIPTNRILRFQGNVVKQQRRQLLPRRIARRGPQPHPKPLLRRQTKPLDLVRQQVPRRPKTSRTKRSTRPFTSNTSSPSSSVAPTIATIFAWPVRSGSSRHVASNGDRDRSSFF
jgi:hypothetical protein